MSFLQFIYLTYINTVVNCLVLYPDIFPNRLKIDDFLFANIGTGYEWMNGQLCNTIGYTKEQIDMLTAKLNSFDMPKEGCTARDIPEELMGRYTDYSFDTINQHFIGPALKRIMKSNGDSDFSHESQSKHIRKFMLTIYQMCQYSPICNIPDDIQDDWLYALDHFIDYCLDNKENLNQDGLSGQVKILEETREKISSIKKLRRI